MGPSDMLSVQDVQRSIDDFLLSLPLGTDPASAEVERRVADRLLQAETQKAVLTKKLHDWSNVAVDLHVMVQQQHRHLQTVTAQLVAQHVKANEQQAEMHKHLLPAVAAQAAAMTASMMGGGSSTGSPGGPGLSHQGPLATPRQQLLPAVPADAGAPDTGYLRHIQDAMRELTPLPSLPGGKQHMLPSGSDAGHALTWQSRSSQQGRTSDSGSSDRIGVHRPSVASSGSKLHSATSDKLGSFMTCNTMDAFAVVARESATSLPDLDALGSEQASVPADVVRALQRELATCRAALSEQSRATAQASAETEVLRAALRDAEMDMQRLSQVVSVRTSEGTGSDMSLHTGRLPSTSAPSLQSSTDHRLVETQHALYEAQQALEEKQHQLEASHSEVAKLQSQLAATDSAHVKLEGVCRELKTQLHLLQEDESRLRTEMREAGGAQAEVESRLVTSQAECNRLRAELQATGLQARRLESENAELQVCDVAMEDELRVLTQRSEADMAELKVSLDKTAAERLQQVEDRHQEQVDALEASLRAAQQRAEWLEQQLEVQVAGHEAGLGEERMSQLEAAAAEAQAAAEAAQVALQQLQEENQALKTRVADHEMELEQRKQVHERKRRTTLDEQAWEAALRQDIEASAAMQEATRLRQLVEALRDLSDHGRVVPLVCRKDNTHGEEQDDQGAVLADVEEAWLDIEDVVQQQRERHAQMLQQQAALETALCEVQTAQAQSDLSVQLELELENLRDKLSSYHDLEQQLEVSQQDVGTLRQQLEDAHAAQSSLQSELDAAHAECERLLGALQEADAARSSFAQSREQIYDDLEQLRAELQHRTSTCATLSSQLDDLERQHREQLRRMESQHSAAILVMQTEHTKEAEAQDQKLTEANEELDAAQDVVNVLQERLDEANEDASEARHQLQQAQEERDAAKAQLDQTKALHDSLYTQLAITQAALAETQAEQLRLAQEHGALRRDHQVLDKRHRETVEELESRRATKQSGGSPEKANELQQHLEVAWQERDRLQAEVTQLRASAAERQEEMLSIREQFLACQQELWQSAQASKQVSEDKTRLEELLCTAQDTASQAAKENEDLKRAYAEAQSSLEAAKTQLSADLSAATERMQEAERRTAEAEAQLGILRARMADLEQQLLGAESITRYQSNRIANLEGENDDLSSRLVTAIHGKRKDAGSPGAGHTKLPAAHGSEVGLGDKEHRHREAMLQEEVARLNSVVESLEAALTLRQQRLEAAQAAADMAVEQLDQLRLAQRPSLQQSPGSTVSPARVRSPHRHTPSSPLAAQVAAAIQEQSISQRHGSARGRQHGAMGHSGAYMEDSPWSSHQYTHSDMHAEQGAVADSRARHLQHTAAADNRHQAQHSSLSVRLEAGGLAGADAEAVDDDRWQESSSVPDVSERQPKVAAVHEETPTRSHTPLLRRVQQQGTAKDVFKVPAPRPRPAAQPTEQQQQQLLRTPARTPAAATAGVGASPAGFSSSAWSTPNRVSVAGSGTSTPQSAVSKHVQTMLARRDRDLRRASSKMEELQKQLDRLAVAAGQLPSMSHSPSVSAAGGSKTPSGVQTRAAATHHAQPAGNTSTSATTNAAAAHGPRQRRGYATLSLRRGQATGPGQTAAADTEAHELEHRPMPDWLASQLARACGYESDSTFNSEYP